MSEDSLVSYWEKFGAVAFDNSVKAIMTACKMKRSISETTFGIDAASHLIECCFSFTIHRDSHNMFVILEFLRSRQTRMLTLCRPSLIVGNFLPIRATQ